MEKVEGPAQDPCQRATGEDRDRREGEADSTAALLRRIETEFQLAAGRPESVEAACDRLRERLASPPTPSELEQLARLAPLLRERGGAIAATLFSLLEQVAAAGDSPWVLIEGMVCARDPELAHRAIRLAVRLGESGSRPVPRRVVEVLAERVEAEASPLTDAAALAEIARIVRRPRELYLDEESGPVRRLAARVLDQDGQPAPAELAERLLGPEACATLRPYLVYTRATHLDLLWLARADRKPPPIVASLRRARETCGEALLRQVVAELGWPRVNMGLEVRRVLGVSIGGSLPFMVAPWEAPLLESLEEARRVSDAFLFFAHGGQSGEGPPGGSSEAIVARFRSYNLIHAEVLGDILGVGPLTAEKVRRILDRMDALVEHFRALFASQAEECALLGSVYHELRGRIVAELGGQIASDRLSAELTRLVQSFEDPRSLGEVRTLHGLKRHLHQRGLQLAFRLVEVGRATNRTVDVLVASPTGRLRRGRGIQYVDFEPEAAAGERVPYPVAVVAEGFGRQLLHGQEAFPSVSIFCYANEVHYYLAFLNHPAFLRIDYAPPLQGGMIDLEYYGVSKYELSVHPSPSLDAIRLFLRELELEARVEDTRIHARYDKERALDLGDLCRKAEALFRLAPYLMDVDWTIGALELPAEARQKVAEAWARSFARWGALPVKQLLTRDRRGILLAVEAGPAGEREIRWSGQGPYRDRFRSPPPAGRFRPIRSSLEELGLDVVSPVDEDGEEPIGQIGLERLLLRPLREALARGEVVATSEGLRPPSSDRFQREDEAVRFAEILGSSDEAVGAAVQVARLVAPLERSLRFRTTGDVDGHEVQRALLTLRGEAIDLYVLRDAGGMIRLALFSRGESLCRRREDPADPWSYGGSTDAAALASLLRANSYLTPGAEATAEDARDEAVRTRERFRRTSRARPPVPLAGEKIVCGLRASPGRVVGKALFRTEGRRPQDFDGAVLVAPLLRPQDNTFLFHAAGIVSTGGGVLSHAGLIAMQFRKPALIIPGRWQTQADGSLTLLYRSLEYREEEREVGGFRVSLRRDTREREHRLREGDLVALEADQGTLRGLGQGGDTLALHEGLRLLGELGRRLARSKDDAETLALRGRRLRARYQVEKLLGRLADPALARHIVYELLLGEARGADGGDAGRGSLLSVVLRNPRIAKPAREHLLHLADELSRRRRAAGERAEERIPSSSAYEVLALRLDLLRLQGALEDAACSLEACGLGTSLPSMSDAAAVEVRAWCRLEEIRSECLRAVEGADSAPGGRFRLRHTLRQLDRVDELLGTPEAERCRRARGRLAREDEAARHRAQGRRVLAAADGGFELFPSIGWKAANLAELERLAGPGLVPPWFVVTNDAFEEVLDAPLTRRAAALDGIPPRASTLREAIDSTLRRAAVDDTRKSALIRALWDAVDLPPGLCAEVAEAYVRLGQNTPEPAAADGGSSPPFVAVRSSAREEDAEIAARAGEFDTFLFVRGERTLLEHLARAWSGLWTERAIHNRAALGLGAERIGGGVIVQRMVPSRASGVLQTINVVEGEAREMVVNAGLGLGEGIVSGIVAADHVVVAKEADPERPPRFRYVTADKQERLAFDERRGLGTVRVESLYHQRLRPALEYVELAELVRIASRLEAAYGYPLDIEFGIEGTRLFILQVRPVPALVSLLRETGERYPLAAAERHASHAAV
jgi:pyruvate,water dikinase